MTAPAPSTPPKPDLRCRVWPGPCLMVRAWGHYRCEMCGRKVIASGHTSPFGRY